MQFKSVNPYNGKILETFDGDLIDQIKTKIKGAHKEFLRWRNTGFEDRTRFMNLASEELLKNKEHYSASITLEMGKPIKESIAEIEKCAKVCKYYAEHAESFLSDEMLDVPHGEACIHYNPIGVVLAVMPWNFPFWQVFRFAAPAIMAGNTCLLKHASNVPKCAMDIEKVFKNAGFPANIFNTLLISSSDVNDVIEHDLVAAVTLTGSEHAGGCVASTAGKNIKKSVLELGGSDAFIVLDDADINQAAKTGVMGRMLNTGQSCIAAKRFILEKAIAEDFTSLFIEELKKLSFGDPMKQETDFGTLARQDLAEEIYEQVEKSIDLGAQVLYGKLPEEINSAYFPPMILGNLKPGMPAYDEEIFGPVALFIIAEDVNESIRIANDSKFGLGGSLWTNDPENLKLITDKIESGAIYVNQMMFSDPSVPFGGIKNSGYGRELSHLGIREFTNQKTIWIN